MTAERSNPDAAWDLDSVVQTLRRQAGAGGTASAHVFLDETTAGDELTASARRIVEEASRRAGQCGGADIGKVHRLARSFSVRADPDLIAEIGRTPGVRSILPSEIEDAYPKPVRHRPVT